MTRYDTLFLWSPGKSQLFRYFIIVYLMGGACQYLLEQALLIYIFSIF